jgi:hypothetical protein
MNCLMRSLKLVIFTEYIRAVVPKLWPPDPMGSVTSSQGLCGYISVMATLRLTNFFN